MKYLYWLCVTILILTLFLYSCQNKPASKAAEIWNNTVTTHLEEEPISLKLPNVFKRTSRYRIKEDLPILNTEPERLKMLQNHLERLELMDNVVDIFVDTTTNFRILIICDTERMDFTKGDVTFMKMELETENKRLQAANPNFQYGDMYAKMNTNGKLVLAKYQYVIRNLILDTRMFNSIYYLTADAFSLIVFEMSDKPEEIENYLWSVKGHY